jgi:ATP-dependent DNA helicase RecQ
MIEENKISLKNYLKQYFGFDRFKGNQEEIIQSLLEGNDVFVLLPTGGGKSLCYQMPALLTNKGPGIIISPLIALMKNQVDMMRNYNDDDSIAHHLNSSLSKSAIEKVKSDVLNNKTKLLYVAPESLTKEENVKFFKKVNVSFYAIDEAHCISEWGHDFRPVYREIRPIINKIGRAPVIALTATATPKVQDDILKNLGIQNAKIFKSSFNRSNLYYEVRPKVSINKQIIQFIKRNQGKSGIIYCLSRKKVEELAEVLQINGIKALPYHAGMESKVRTQTQDKFLREDIDVIIATIAFGMGIDKPDIRYIIHHDIPKSLEGYYQETGRAGRDGGEGKCVTFYSYNDIQKLEKLMQGKPVSEQEIGKQLIMETVAFAESPVCRRKHLLHYFGELYEEENCHHCDNCLNPKKQFEGKEYIIKVIETIFLLKEKFKIDHIANILAGNQTNAIKLYKHHKLDFFGDNDKDAHFWNSIIRQALIAQLLKKEIENYGLLKVTDKGHEYLQNPYPFPITEDRKTQDDEDDIEVTGAHKTGGVDTELINILKDLRKKVAKKNNLPPFVIFQDFSLDDMAIQYPTTLDELQKITGVGEGKANKYGQEFVDLIKQYVEEKEIIRPQEMVVKSVINKSGLKVYIIQSIDRKLPLEDIAEAKNLPLNELLNHIEAIVKSGTKIDIDYYINQKVDDDKQEDIFEYFREDAETESIQEALSELGEDEYSEEDIRLMRIKFLSEMGN